MTPELLCYLAASLVALQIVAVFLRKEHLDELPYLGLLAADLALLVWVRATGSYDTMFAFVGAAVAGVLTLIPPILERMEKRAVADERFGRAASFAAVREILMPGRGPTRRRRILSALHEAALGGSAAALEKLEAELATTRDERTRDELRVQVASLLLYEHRFADAIAYVTQHLDESQIVAQPALCANLIRAYASVEEFGRALALLRGLEAGKTARDPLGAAIIQQSRLSLLAAAGRTDELVAVLGVGSERIITSDAARFWLDTARARSLTPRVFEPEVVAELDRVAKDARAFVTRAESVIRRRTPLTQVLVAANLIAYFSGRLLSPVGDDSWILRAGALFRPVVLAGEWWRAVSAMFLHAGSLHLFVNMYGLYLLGRFTESLFGSPRFLVIYIGGGLAGAALSTYYGAGVVSVGASGAILGLLGALVVLLVQRRGVWPEAWRRTLLVNLVVLGALQIAMGFAVSMIDNAAHLGGMLGGALVAFTMRPPADPARESRVGRAWSFLLAVVTAAILVYSALKVSTTTISESLERVPTIRVALEGGTLDVPNYWIVDKPSNTTGDPYLDLRVTIVRDDGPIHATSPDLGDPRYRPLLERVIRSFVPGRDER